MATITNLYTLYWKTSCRTGLPILALMHGWTGSTASFAEDTLVRLANYGLFVIAPGMRGRDSADGNQDASGREIYDIYDAIQRVITDYSSLVDSDHIAIVGYSGGGGNALAAACKFPDTFNVVVSHFGMSDYGYDGTDGWYQNGADAGQKTNMENWIGDTPTNVPNAYYARAAVEAIAQNYMQGHLYLFHDKQDSSVPVVNSENVGAAMSNAGLSNYTENYTDTGDDPRWTHGYPSAIADLQQAESIWVQAIADKTYSVWTVPESGTVTVLGYIVTKRFEIWLGTTTKAGAGGGLDEVATVVYDVTADEYVVTPLTGSCDVYVEQADGKTGTASGISSETTITVT